jgi:hypothetical protein
METAHPVVSLLAFVDSDFAPHHVEELHQLADDLAARRNDWILGPPRFIDETDEDGVRTVGLIHRVYSAFDDRGTILDDAIDRRQLEEVRALIAGLQALSAASGIDFGVELDCGSVGWVEQGELTADLRIGLLEAWAARFA